MNDTMSGFGSLADKVLQKPQNKQNLARISDDSTDSNSAKRATPIFQEIRVPLFKIDCVPKIKASNLYTKRSLRLKQWESPSKPIGVRQDDELFQLPIITNRLSQNFTRNPTVIRQRLDCHFI